MHWAVSLSLCVATGYECHMTSRQRATCWRCKIGSHLAITLYCYRNRERDSHQLLLHKGEREEREREREREMGGGMD